MLFFNRTLGRRAAACETVFGSMGQTDNYMVLHPRTKEAVTLSHCTRSNWAYEGPTVGDEKQNRRLLRAAPVGSYLMEVYDSSWSGQETDQELTFYRKEVHGAWVIAPSPF